MHGSHWYFDAATSPAIDAGHPMDGLGEELERIPDDPEGRWGVNHAIDLGAYGGTTQASLAPHARRRAGRRDGRSAGLLAFRLEQSVVGAQPREAAGCPVSSASR